MNYDEMSKKERKKFELNRIYEIHKGRLTLDSFDTWNDTWNELSIERRLDIARRGISRQRKMVLAARVGKLVDYALIALPLYIAKDNVEDIADSVTNNQYGFFSTVVPAVLIAASPILLWDFVNIIKERPNVILGEEMKLAMLEAEYGRYMQTASRSETHSTV